MTDKTNDLRTLLLGLVRNPDNWEAIDDALAEPFSMDFTHRGSTMQITVGSPYLMPHPHARMMRSIWPASAEGRTHSLDQGDVQ